jgi:acyl-CoA reductase-like NAD-dependent aldehyde dehydrogenase
MMNGSSVQHTSVRNEALAILSRLGVPESTFAREGIASSSPITGEVITHVRITRPEEANAVIGRAAQAFTVWRKVPPPRRGELVRILAEELRAAKDDLGRLVTLETGKIVPVAAWSWNAELHPGRYRSWCWRRRPSLNARCADFSDAPSGLSPF